MSRLQRRTALLAAVSVALLVGGCASGGGGSGDSVAKPIPASLQKMYDAAKAEGTLVLQTAEDSDKITKIFSCFTQQFPGIQLKYTETLAEIAPFITAAQAGRVDVDVLQLPIVSAKDLLDRNLIDTGNYVSTFKDLGLPASFVTDDKLVLDYDSTFPLTYNSSAIGSTPKPTSWDDLLKPEYKDKLVIESRAFPFAALGLAWGQQRMTDYIKAIRQQQPILVTGGTAVGQQLASGRRPIAIGEHGFDVYQLAASGAPVERAYANPVMAMPTMSMVPKKAPHPTVGKLYAAWLASPDGQACQEKVTDKGITLPDSKTREAEDSRAHGVQYLRITLEASDEYNRLTAVGQAQLAGRS